MSIKELKYLIALIQNDVYQTVVDGADFEGKMKLLIRLKEDLNRATKALSTT